MTELDTYVPITKAKSNLLDMVRSLSKKKDTIAITKNGVPEAVLVSIDTYEGLMETIEILADTEAMNIIRSSIKDEKAGNLRSEDEVFDVLSN
jgi:antitoxin YefM